MVYLFAEHLRIFSGVLAVVTAGLILGWRVTDLMLSSETRLQESTQIGKPLRLF